MWNPYYARYFCHRLTPAQRRRIRKRANKLKG